MVKRLFDLCVTVLAVGLLWPVVLILAILIYVKLGAPVLFVQKRPGLNGVPFNMVKFRTMTNTTDAAGNLLPDAERLTRFGRFIRSMSLDELPELWNVLKGEMSLVGPRPLLMQYLPLYSDLQSRRNEVRPGITGWAQVNGRNLLSWDEKFALDIWYIDNCGWWLDLKIIGLTAFKVVRRDGVNSASDITMPVFTGSTVNEPNG